MGVRERVNRFRELRDESGKFSKSQAYYINDAFQKSIRCGNCEYFEADQNKCNLVSEEGTPGRGIISAQGSCSLFNARPLRIKAIQMMWGREDFEGLAPEVARANAFMFTYAFLDEEPPQELRRKATLDPEKIRERTPGL